ncbi:MAG TPA: CBS domain-containing protein [Gemmatimonadales bacterium]|nr:CBS domain-containing protein [Gemmatimonadales bacterium]
MTTIASICNRDVAFTTRETTIAAAAKLMRHGHVGCLVVVEQMNGGRRTPAGIVTDRDIIVEVIAPGLDPATITVGDIMSSELVVGRENGSLQETTEIMRFKGVRRLPIVGGDGQLVGIITIDDVLEVLADELNEIAKIVAREQSNESAARR